MNDLPPFLQIFARLIAGAVLAVWLNSAGSRPPEEKDKTDAAAVTAPALESAPENPEVTPCAQPQANAKPACPVTPATV